MIAVSEHHVLNSDIRIVYPDLVHEFIHIFQLHDGRELFDRKLSYAVHPAELEAYELTARGGRTIGMTERELSDYLKVDWTSEWRTGNSPVKLA